MKKISVLLSLSLVLVVSSVSAQNNNHYTAKIIDFEVEYTAVQGFLILLGAYTVYEAGWAFTIIGPSGNRQIIYDDYGMLSEFLGPTKGGLRGDPDENIQNYKREILSRNLYVEILEDENGEILDLDFFFSY